MTEFVKWFALYAKTMRTVTKRGRDKMMKRPVPFGKKTKMI